MTYSERVQRIREAIIAGIKSCESRILEIGKHPVGSSRISGIAVEVIPFHQVFAIHFRDDDEENTLEYPDWKHYLLYDGTSDNKELLTDLDTEYGAHEDDDRGSEYMLMLGTAVADALLCKEVVDLLQSYAMAQYFKLDELGGSPFDFVVLDLDGCVDGNFCEIIKWKRNICREAIDYS